MKLLIMALSVALLAGCSSSENQSQTLQTIDEVRARQIASDHWSDFIVGKYFLDAAGTRAQYCEFPPDSWHRVTRTDGGWQLVMDPPDGCYATIEMDEYGDNITVVRYGFSVD